jgi:aspartate-semialdehyde dehydrogenase
MAAKILRGVIVGASTLLGKELSEELNGAHPAWDVRLADAGEGDGQIVAAGDEAMLIQPVRPDVFDGVDAAFFAESAAITRSHWREAQAAGARVLDLTGALENETGVLVRSPWMSGGAAPDLTTTAVVPAHPAAVMLGVVATRLQAVFGQARLAATVLEPASQQGNRGVDEMHQQTVSLLGFHSLPQEIYDAQVAFNLRVSVGESAKLDMREIAGTIRRHLGAIAGEAIASSTALQLVQAPVFHGYTMSVFVQLPVRAEPDSVRKALEGGVVEIGADNVESPSNQSVAGDASVRVLVTEETAQAEGGSAYWLWMAADNLKLAARHAVACAVELAALRPSMRVQ